MISLSKMCQLILTISKYHKQKVRIAKRALQKQTYLRRFIWVAEDHGFPYALRYTGLRILTHLGMEDPEEKRKRTIIRPLTKHVDKRVLVLETKLDHLISENEKLVNMLELNERLLLEYGTRIESLEEKVK